MQSLTVAVQHRTPEPVALQRAVAVPERVQRHTPAEEHSAAAAVAAVAAVVVQRRTRELHSELPGPAPAPVEAGRESE